MSAVQFPHLFSPFTIRGVTLRNRIMSTGHETGIVDATGINDALVAYHRTRAAGGAGLIVIEVASVHPSATFVRNSIKLYRDEAISGYRRLADAAHENGAVLFAQLFHPGRQFTLGALAPPQRPTPRFPARRSSRGSCGRSLTGAAGRGQRRHFVCNIFLEVPRGDAPTDVRMP